MIRQGVLLLLCATVVSGSVAMASVGRLDILTDVHGYSADGHTMVPMRGVAEWLGAEVRYSAPHITIASGSTEVRLAVGSRQAHVNGRAVQMSAPATVYGGITCVPLRFVAEGLGLQVSYHAGQDPEMMNTCDIPVAILKGQGRTARILIHQEPPNVVARVIGDLENSVQVHRVIGFGGRLEESERYRVGRYGIDFILQVTKIHDGYFLSSDLCAWEVPAYAGPGSQPLFECYAEAIYAYRNGRWIQLMGFQDLPDGWHAALGIPAGVARKLISTVR